MPAEEAPMAEEPAAEEEPMADGAYNESPMLAEMVAAGTLPPVEERLPNEPFVVTNRMLVVSYDTEIGKYGRYDAACPRTGPAAIRTSTSVPLSLWSGHPAPSTTTWGSTAMSSRTGRPTTDTMSIRCPLREGMKWSDGEPVTTADVDFTWNDVITNEEVTASTVKLPAHPVPHRQQAWPRLKSWTTTPSPSPSTTSTAVSPAQLAIAQWRGYQDFLKPRPLPEAVPRGLRGCGRTGSQDGGRVD